MTQHNHSAPSSKSSPSRHQAKNKHRSIFISDLHMGYKGFDARACLRFLRDHDCENLYLLGDIIDGWKLKKRWFWTRDCSLIIDELVKKSQEGTKVFYIPGNHDDLIRRINPMRRIKFAKRFNMTIKNVHIHRTANGRRFIVMHGDQFDSRIVRGKLSEWADRLFTFFAERGLTAPKIEHIHINGTPRNFSLAKRIAGTSKKAALSIMSNLERSIFHLVRNRNVDGLICGHTHIALQQVSYDGQIYYNTGAWMGKKNTALIEHNSGEISLLHYPDFRRETYHPKHFKLQTIEELGSHHKLTQKLVRKIHKFWHVDSVSHSSETRDTHPTIELDIHIKPLFGKLASAP